MTHSLIVGGTRGLGRVVARQFSAAGHKVTVLGRRAPPASDEGMSNVRHVIADLRDPPTIDQALADAVAASGPLNYVVFCQRFRGEGDAWAGEIEVSLNATRRVIDTATPLFATDGDRAIVVVSSVFGHYVGEGQPASYHVGKAGLDHLARFHAVNLGRKGIRVNIVTPFTFLKEESRDFYLGNEPLHDLYRRITPLGRMATTEDSANVISFLCSPQAGFVNGQNIVVDGGLSLMWPETIARQLTAL
jgi:NAD(P)-dependent dehydrogenase (short-subunit alcohol dehydrogenase family)